MASHFQAQKPYVLNTLPRPLDPTTGRYVVGEVYGSKPGSRKRKRRTELSVGIDGEAINIYDVSSARLITSYPIPPQSRISCPITTIRRRVGETKEIARYTYAATNDSQRHEVNLFKDYVDLAGKTTSSTHSVSLGQGPSVVCLAPVLSANTSTDGSSATQEEELLVVRENGTVTSLDLENLQTKWTSTPSVLQQDLARASKANFKIDFCRPSPISEVIKGLFKGDGTAFSHLLSAAQGVADDGEVLILVSSSGSVEQKNRHIHIVGLLQQGIVQLHTLPILTPPGRGDTDSHYHLDPRTGTLLELRKQTFTMHDLTASSLKSASTTMELEGTTSFLHLSKNSLLCATNSQLNIYNPVFRSLQDTVEIDLDGQAQSQTNDDKTPSSCRLVAYFSPMELAVAIVDSNLVAIQLEVPRKRSTKRRAEGLLIDSIGRGLRTAKRTSTQVSRQLPEKSVFTNYLPGTIQGDYWQKWIENEARADSLLNANDMYGFEKLLAKKFGLRVNNSQVPNGVSDDNTPKDFPSWQWPKKRRKYPWVDRRWILYAISRVFRWNEGPPGDLTIPRLTCQLPKSNVVCYLVDAGHLTLSNVKAAFRESLGAAEQADSFLAEQLVTRLADIDPSLEFLVAYLSTTKIGVTELLLGLRTIMRSFELVQDPRKPPPKLPTEGATEQTTNGIDEIENEKIGMELDDLEHEIEKAVSYLSEDARIHRTGLSVAFVKLGKCSGISTIKALRSTFKPEEILSLVHLLRVELVKGGWTSRYLDSTDFERDTSLDAPPDGVIKLLADLLGRCVDSIGPGGWLLNDAMLASDDSGDFMASLKLEVSAALEGIEEATYLRGVVGEAVKFFKLSSPPSTRKKTREGRGAGNNRVARAAKIKPISIRIREPMDDALPLGLRPAFERISSHKVVSGGEIVPRSKRETGLLISRQVGAYSLERIII
ncbi:hypothetical protein F5X99DRAFT_375874 [Biscogniauxia marginata]|nr:hypothetical protein F5X99DRAFT_375874 [Biscogniauxia marginata]